MTLNDDIVRKAFKGAAIRSNKELWVSYGGQVPPDDLKAIEAVENDLQGFQDLVNAKLGALPHTDQYFGDLIRTRLNQAKVLESDLISSLFDTSSIVEQRLHRLINVPIVGLETLKAEYRSTTDVTKGNLTDEKARDFLAEILLLDFLVALGFQDIQKLASTNASHVDILARKDAAEYAIEIRRKKEMTDWEIQSRTQLEDCNSAANRQMIERIIARVLGDKNDQFQRAIAANTLNASRIKWVAIKTSDYGFSECIDEVASIAKMILSRSGQWQYVDSIWLVPNVEVSESRWISR